ncbi:proton-dependent oligopeptide transporter family protein, partial [Tanacetum coccineum]
LARSSRVDEQPSRRAAESTSSRVDEQPSRRAAESSREAAESTSSRVNNIGETSNEPTQATCNEFEELYASANEELYPGCDKVVDILCDLELIYHPALFDIMVHLVIHLPLEALEGRAYSPGCLPPTFNRRQTDVTPPPMCWFQVFRSAKAHESPIWAAGERAGCIPRKEPKPFDLKETRMAKARLDQI